MLHAVIMAGGSGTRLWPSSRRRRPKQAIALMGAKSLFERAVERVSGLVPPERVFVITNAEQADLLAAQAPGIPRENIVGEPFGRDSSAAVFLAAAITSARDEEAVNLVVTADHLISPVESFEDAARRAACLASQDFLVTFGIPPTRPATGYGYIEKGKKLAEPPGAWRIVRFKEKPDRETAERYIKEGRYCWNSGMFVWKASLVLEAAAEFAPQHHKRIAPLGARFGTDDFPEALAEAYEPLEKISIDFAVMEHARNVAAVESEFDWSDVGSHAALRAITKRDDGGNAIEGITEILDSTGCIVSSSGEHLVALYGCEDMVVIHTDDATLVCPAKRAEELKKLVGEMEKKRELQDYL